MAWSCTRRNANAFAPKCGLTIRSSRRTPGCALRARLTSNVSRLMTQHRPCKSCGELIHPDTAAKNGGLCRPCKGGYRANIEAGKKRREEERIYEQSAERKHWRALVSRVYDRPSGFEALRAPEKLYFAVSCLIGEVYNGGFDQFFWLITEFSGMVHWPGPDQACRSRRGCARGSSRSYGSPARLTSSLG